jgi:hypothetical protein
VDAHEHVLEVSERVEALELARNATTARTTPRYDPVAARRRHYETLIAPAKGATVVDVGVDDGGAPHRVLQCRDGSLTDGEGSRAQVFGRHHLRVAIGWRESPAWRHARSSRTLC